MMMLSPHFLARSVSGLLFLAVAAATSATPEEAFLRGNLAYAEGDYTEAESAYREAAANIRSASLQYNLGNSLARQDRWGEAAFHYLAAHSLDPGLDAARANLLLCAEELGFEESPFPEIREPAALLPRHQWLLAGTAAFWLGLFFLCHRRLLPVHLPFPRLLGFGGLLIALVAAVAVWQYDRFGGWAVLPSAALPLRVAPAADSPAEITLPEGSPVRILQSEGAYVKVRTRDRAEGFLRADEVRPVQDH
ncbi:MAG: tetratricopeptide repeat protein [Verrucomicrobia bacterium]|jgi:tetratricopeptide (TPR) repeat protein|nr:tetratricopeptide repeat protein [Verrucomicrobiota bacterium]